MQYIKQSEGGIDYLKAVLREKAKVVTRVIFWKIPRKTNVADKICLKIGRYHRDEAGSLAVESQAPKSELTLDDEEFQSLITFISENYKPFRDGVRRYIPIDEKFDQKNIVHLRALFKNPEKQTLLAFIAENNILPEDLLTDLQHQKRIFALDVFESMLHQDLPEQDWQKWLKENPWVLGTEFVRVLDERNVDTENITDYLMQAYDGFVDIVEIKRPNGGLRFWAATKDHGNCVPSSDLTKAITQSMRYIYEVEREANSVKFLERVGNIKTVKPRCVLVFGRSDDWDDHEKESYRILSAGFHNISIMTYDHVLARARRILGLDEDRSSKTLLSPTKVNEANIPF